MAQIIAVGSGAATSLDVTVAAGDSLTIALNDAAGQDIPDGTILIQLKDPAGEYFNVGQLTRSNAAQLIIAAGTYRFVRVPGSTCGVFSA